MGTVKIPEMFNSNRQCGRKGKSLSLIHILQDYTPRAIKAYTVAFSEIKSRILCLNGILKAFVMKCHRGLNI